MLLQISDLFSIFGNQLHSQPCLLVSERGLLALDRPLNTAEREGISAFCTDLDLTRYRCTATKQPWAITLSFRRQEQRTQL